MIEGIGSRDGDRPIDWGRTSSDYAAHRPGYPGVLFDALARLGVGLPGQDVLDLGTGTGNLARAFAARGCRVVGVDVSEGQVAEARRLAEAAGPCASVSFRVAPAEATGQPDDAFDAVTAGQCWLYFDAGRACSEVRRVLRPGGRLATCHLSWVPREDPIARASEELVLRHNPDWSAADWPGVVPDVPRWSEGRFRVVGRIVEDLELPFTRETWRGRFRACRGIGATLSGEAVAAFDAEHAELLVATVPQEFTVLHRLDAHVMEPLGD